MPTQQTSSDHTSSLRVTTSSRHTRHLSWHTTILQPAPASDGEWLQLLVVSTTGMSVTLGKLVHVCIPSGQVCSNTDQPLYACLI